MPRVALIDANAAAPAAKPVLEKIQAAFGETPNMFKAVANSPAALRSMWGSFEALGSGSISARLVELMAVAVANRNGCEYCLAAHSALAGPLGATEEDLRLAQEGKAKSPRVEAALGFARKLVDAKGHVTEADLLTLKEHGFSDAEIVDIIAIVCLNIFTNYVNNALKVPLDFPKVEMIGKP